MKTIALTPEQYEKVRQKKLSPSIKTEKGIVLWRIYRD